MLARLLRVGSALLVLAPPSAREELVFDVSARTVLERTLESGFDLDLDSMTLSVDGEEVPPEALGEYEVHVEHSERCVITDTFEAVEGGRPTRLRRSFDALTGRETTRATGEDGQGQVQEDREYESDLEGRTVLFAWNDEDARFEASFEGQGGDGALLERLQEDLDLRRFLPGGPVAEGESWEVDVQAFQAVLEPGGDLALAEAGAADEPDPEKDAALREHLAGRVRASFAGVLEEDGLRLAEVELVIEAATYAEGELAPADLPEGGSGSSRSDVVFRLEGRLGWDLVHAHARSLDLAGEYRVTSTYLVRGQLEGEPFEQEQGLVFGGEIRFTTRVERR